MTKWLALTCLLSSSFCTAQTFSATPLNDLGAGLYLNQFQGGLYENGTNDVPADHTTDGVNFASQVGQSGPFVFLGIGMSNAELEFGAFTTFLDEKSQKGKLNDNMTVLNGGLGDYVACTWSYPYGTPQQNGCSHVNHDANQNPYYLVRKMLLAPAHLSESAV